MLKDEVRKKNQLKRTTKVKTNNSNKKIWIRFDRKKKHKEDEIEKKIKIKNYLKTKQISIKRMGAIFEK